MKILNVGCGQDTYGTHFVDLYPSRKNVIKCDIDSEKLPFKNNYFDLVYSKNLLEHLKNPGFSLKEMSRTLKKGRKLVIITDNASYWLWSLPNTFHSGGYEKHNKNIKDRHYCLFTEHHLRNHFKECGIKLVKIKYEGLPLNIQNVKLTKKIVRGTIKLIDFFLRKTPFWRLSYERIRIEGVKK